MNIHFELPLNIEQRVCSKGTDPNREAKEAYLVRPLPPGAD